MTPAKAKIKNPLFVRELRQRTLKTFLPDFSWAIIVRCALNQITLHDLTRYYSTPRAVATT